MSMFLRATALSRWVLGLFAGVVLAAGSAMAQQPDSKGTEFILMFNQNFNQPNMNLFITGDIATSGSVDIPGIGFSAPFSVVPGTVTTVALPDSAEEDLLDTVNDKGIFVTADDEVTVYGLNQLVNSTDAFLGLPTDILGTSYINQGYENTNVINATQFGIVATTDNTTVTITPTVTAGPRPAGVPFQITMDRGDTYQLRSTLSAPADLSGTTITADNPIAVFGGHQCANIPFGEVACDHIVEQMPPTTTWGQSFVTFPLATRIGGDTFRVLASEDNTSVAINGANVATLNAGEIFETILTAASTVNADKPVLLTQYSNGTSFDSVTSDPFQLVVPPSEQFLAGYTVSTPSTGFQINFINIVAPDAAVGSITVDGVPIPAGDFSSIGASGFSGAQVDVSVGSHTVDGPLPFGISVYGYAFADSYGYPGGLALGEVAELVEVQLTPATATNPVNTEHCVTAATLDQNSEPLQGILVNFTVNGANTDSGFGSTDAQGDVEFCYTGANVGTDAIVATAGNNLTAEAEHIWQEAGGEGGLAACDGDDDGVISRFDVWMIAVFRGTEVDPGSNGDFDSDGVITRRDFKACLQELGTQLPG